MLRRRDESVEPQPRLKSSPKNSPRSGRSQSVGPSVTDRRSPKRRPASVTKVFFFYYIYCFNTFFIKYCV